MLTVGQEGSPLIEINGGSDIWTVAFAANGEYIVGSGDGQRVWRVQDGAQMATMEAVAAARDVRSHVAVSKDGSWIAAGTGWGEVFVWDARTFELEVSTPKDDSVIFAVDFSPDSTRVVTGSDQTADVWDVAARKKVLTLDHKDWVRAAKYSPQGDRIATATEKSVRVWDSNDGRLLVDIPVYVAPRFNTALLWSKNHLFVVSGSTIKKLEASTGLTVSEWPVATNVIDNDSHILLPQHGEFVAYSTNRAVTFWDTSTHAQLGLIRHPQDIDIYSIALSPDDRFLAILGHGGAITIRSLSHITVGIVFLWIMAGLNEFPVPLF